MKKVFVVLVSVVALSGCKKDSGISPSPSSSGTKKLMKSTYVFDNGTPENEVYTYDGQGRLSSVVDDNSKETFDYSSSTQLVVTQRKNTDNSLMQTKECTLNDKGYITRIIFKNSAGTITYTYEFTYNAEGYIIKQKGFSNTSSYENEYTIIDGNPVSAKSYFDNVFTYNRYYTYDNTKPNKTPFSYSGYWPSQTLFGKNTANLLIEFKEFNTSNILTWHTQSIYETDAAGYPVKITTSYPLQGKQGIDNYIFQ